MANNKKISELPADTSAKDADMLVMVSDGVTKKITVKDFLKNGSPQEQSIINAIIFG